MTSDLQDRNRRIVKTILRYPILRPGLRKQQRQLNSQSERSLEREIVIKYFGDPQYYPLPADAYLQTRAGRKDLADNMSVRLAEFRALVVPWLDSILPLKKSRVLEIGCGTGSSSVALAEQGTKLVGLDVSGRALDVARLRFELYGLEGAFHLANATDLRTVAAGGDFDAIIFFAVLEHMTWRERRDSLRDAWSLLRSGQHLVIVETPNRLWCTDSHTSLEPFFHWLPDEIAIPYARFSRRDIFNEIFGNSLEERDDETKVRFARWGRGVSYHDLVLSLNIKPEQLPVVSAMQLFLRNRSLEYFVRSARRWRYASVLRKLTPGVHPGLLLEDLYIALRKP